MEYIAWLIFIFFISYLVVKFTDDGDMPKSSNAVTNSHNTKNHISSNQSRNNMKLTFSYEPIELQPLEFSDEEYEEIYKYNTCNDFPNDFITVDVETTGLSPKTQKIVQISAIKYIDNEKTDEFNFYVNPEMHIPKKASSIHGIYDEDVEFESTITDILPFFLDFIEDYTLVAHHASFDMKFIQLALALNGYEGLTNPVIDTLSLARKYMNTQNHKLETLKDFLNIDATSHNALDDCMVAGEVYMYCKKCASKHSA